MSHCLSEGTNLNLFCILIPSYDNCGPPYFSNYLNTFSEYFPFFSHLGFYFSAFFFSGGRFFASFSSCIFLYSVQDYYLFLAVLLYLLLLLFFVCVIKTYFLFEVNVSTWDFCLNFWVELLSRIDTDSFKQVSSRLFSFLIFFFFFYPYGNWWLSFTSQEFWPQTIM